MNRILNSTTVFATIVSVSLSASAVQANGSSKNPNTGGSRITSKLQKGPGIGSTNPSNPNQGSNPTQPTNPSPKTPPVWTKFPPNTKPIGGIFNQPKLPPVWSKFPPNTTAIGSIFNQPSKPNPTPTPTPKPTKPPMGNGHGFGGYGGGSFGGTVVTTNVSTDTVTTGNVTTPTADNASVPPAPTTANSDADAAPAMEVAAGSSFTLKGEKFGDKQGQVGLVVGGVLIPVQVTGWSDSAITVNVPMLGVDANAKATFVVKRADGSVAQGMACELVAAR
jgi:hypothetical protein